jgi:hypothetical protein
MSRQPRRGDQDGYEYKVRISNIRQFVKLYIRLFSPSAEVLQFDSYLRRLEEILPELDQCRRVQDLHGTLGNFVRQYFCYFYNCWVKYIYLPVAWDFYQVVFHEAIKVALSSVEKQDLKIFAAQFRAFRELEAWFLQPTASEQLERALQCAIKGSEDLRKRRAHKKIFTEVVLPKLKQFEPRSKQFVICHRAADEIDGFVDALRTLFGGPLPLCFRAGNFTLEEKMSNFIGTAKNWSTQQLDDRFPSEAPLASAVTSQCDTREFKRWMRENYEQKLKEFKKSVEKEFRRKYPSVKTNIEQENKKLKQARQDLAVRCETDVKAQVRRVKQQANDEAARLEALIQGVKAEKAAVRSEEAVSRARQGLVVQIGQQGQQLAQIEETALDNYTRLHSVLIRMRNHLATEADTISRLKRRLGIAAGPEEDGAKTVAGLSLGASLRVICGRLEGDWEELTKASRGGGTNA